MKSSTDEQQYIDRVVAGDVSAFAFLVERHKNMAFSIAFRILKNREDAEEVAQDAFLKTFRSIGEFRKDAKFSTWLYRIVYNMAISRTRIRVLDTIPIGDEMTDRIPSGEMESGLSLLDDDEQRALAGRILEGLPELDHLLVTLFYYDGNSTEEISSITGLTVSNVKVKLHRIRKRLYGELQRHLEKEKTLVR